MSLFDFNTAQGYSYGLPEQLEAGVINLLKAAGVVSTQVDPITGSQSVVSADGKSLFSGVASSSVRTVLFGHSYIAQETGGNATLDSFDLWQAVGTVCVANAMMGHPLRIVKTVAAGGRRILDLLPRYAAEVAPLRPRLVFVNIGHNDLKGLYGGFSDQSAVGPSEQQRELEYLIARMRTWLANDVAPETTIVLMGETPPGKDPAGTVSANNQANLAIRFEKWNRMLSALVTEIGARNLVYVPLDRVTVNPASLSMVNKDGHYYDTVHPGIVGAFARAKVLAKHLERIIPIHTDPLPTWQGDNYTNAKIALTANPTFANGVGVATFDNTKIGDFRKIEVGEWVTLMVPTSANSTLGGRYLVTEATDAGVKVAVPSDLSGTANTTGFISNSSQLFVNPLLTTTTGGQVIGGSVAGTITGNMPLGVDIANLPATHAVTVTTEAHTQRDGSPGFGNWLKLAVTVSGAAGASQFEVRFRAAATSPSSAPAYDHDRKVNVQQTVQFGLEVKQAGATGGYAGVATDVQGNVTDPPGSGNSVTYRASAMYRDSGRVPNTALHPWPAEDMTLTLVTPEMTFERDSLKSQRIVTNLDGRLYVNFFGNGTVNLYIGRVGFNCVDYPQEQLLIATAAGT